MVETDGTLIAVVVTLLVIVINAICIYLLIVVCRRKCCVTTSPPLFYYVTDVVRGNELLSASDEQECMAHEYETLPEKYNMAKPSQNKDNPAGGYTLPLSAHTHHKATAPYLNVPDSSLPAAKEIAPNDSYEIPVPTCVCCSSTTNAAMATVDRRRMREHLLRINMDETHVGVYTQDGECLMNKVMDQSLSSSPKVMLQLAIH